MTRTDEAPRRRGQVEADRPPSKGGATAAQTDRGLAAVERWRERLVRDAEALDTLCAEAPHADRSRLSALILRVARERAANGPPHAYRELFRALNNLFSTNA